MVKTLNGIMNQEEYQSVLAVSHGGARVNAVNLGLMAIASLGGSLLGEDIVRKFDSVFSFLLCGLGHLAIAIAMRVNRLAYTLPKTEDMGNRFCLPIYEADGGIGTGAGSQPGMPSVLDGLSFTPGNQVVGVFRGSRVRLGQGHKLPGQALLQGGLVEVGQGNPQVHLLDGSLVGGNMGPVGLIEMPEVALLHPRPLSACQSCGC